MNDFELRAECIRQASVNLDHEACDTDKVIAEAQKLYNFIIGGIATKPTDYSHEDCSGSYNGTGSAYQPSSI